MNQALDKAKEDNKSQVNKQIKLNIPIRTLKKIIQDFSHFIKQNMNAISYFIIEMLLFYIPWKKFKCIHTEENSLSGLSKIHLTIYKRACFEFQAHSKNKQNGRHVSLQFKVHCASFFRIRNAWYIFLQNISFCVTYIV